MDRKDRPINPFAEHVGRGMGLGAVLNVGLILEAVRRFPTAWSGSSHGPRDVVAGIAMACVYAIVGRYGAAWTERSSPRALRLGVALGLTMGLGFAASMLVEYSLIANAHQNQNLGLVTFGSFLLLMALAGAGGTAGQGRLKDGIKAAFWTALIASQCWFILVLGIYLAFLGTSAEARFLENDQVLADFARSGMNDLRAFILQDYLGGGFFHSLLVPLISVPLVLPH